MKKGHKFHNYAASNRKADKEDKNRVDGGMNLFKNVKNNDYIKYKTTHRTKGRNTEMVAAACLYMACRIEKYPLLLIDFLSATET